MDKKSEIAMFKGRAAAQAAESVRQATTATATLTAPAASSPPSAGEVPSGWWMYHGGPDHQGYVSDSTLNSGNINATAFTTLFTLQLGGPILSVPAVVDGFIYVGIANYHLAEGGNGGALHKIDIQTGETVKTFSWNLGNNANNIPNLEDAHGFTGMGCTPLVINDRVYFGAFDGKLYCLNQDTLELDWVTDLRNEDLAHNQPITNINGVGAGYAPAVIWTSPVISADGTKLYVACGEGENPQLYSFVFCLDPITGNVIWIYCTNLYCTGDFNQPNVLPEQAVQVLPPPAGFSIFPGEPIVMGCSVWGAIAYDKDLNRIYCSTGNQQPEPEGNWTGGPIKPELPSPGFSNGVLSLDADTGQYKAFFQVPAESNYRVSDFDVDIGSAPVVTNLGGEKVVILTCKNGSFFVLDAKTLELKKWRQLLPYQNDGTWIATVDQHPVDANALNPHVDNDESNNTPGENFSGPFNTTAVYPGSADSPTIPPLAFIGMGGPNYHNASPGIDFNSTPFMRALDFSSPTLADYWPMVPGSDPQKYANASHVDEVNGIFAGMYTSAGECGLSSPAVVNDVVFCSTTKVSIYAFRISDGTLLWWDDLGMQTAGFNGGYGYCLGPAIWKNYVVAGALVFGRDGGVLRIYGPTPPPPPVSPPTQ
ncbi:MAG TPA: PQQ-binding-like beta-propeller repeat protein [Pyrinomonadaceae bacterium]|nr:PQQ-binding-like beta-propeller repeat protein [Pyrinomonadaceae bacterium]